MITNDTASIWGKVVESHRALTSATRDFLDREDRVEVLRNSIRGKDRIAALAIARSLKMDEKQRLFPDWVYLASWAHGAVQLGRDMILSLPREWVLANIEQEVEPYLETGTYDEYRRFLELYQQLGSALTQKLARRAAAHSDADIREAGEDFLANSNGAE